VSADSVDSAEQQLGLCDECGQGYIYKPVPRGAKAQCTRCGGVLYRNRNLSFDKSLAFTFAALILFVLANTFPFLGFGLPGDIRHTTLITGSILLFQYGEELLSFIVIFTTVIAPAVQIFMLLYLLIPINMGRKPREIPAVLKTIVVTGQWGMMDVFMLGIMVSTVKLADLGTIVLGPALIAFIVLIFMLAGAQSAFDTERVWSMVKSPKLKAVASGARDLIECHTCHLTVPLVSSIRKNMQCPRCESHLHKRKPDSIQRTWALVIAAFACYLPANLLPIMETSSLGTTQMDTILSGIIYLINHGSWHLALIVFIASVLVPLLKIAILIFLLVSVQLRSRWRPRERTKMYRLAELVGKWSMVDIYVVTIMVALVQMGNLASIAAGAGAIFFCAVVILTMFAAMTFDPNLIWDNLEDKNDGVTAEYA
jgi:paraquat-inducible protein A